MQNLPLSDDFIKTIVCAILKEVEKIPDVQKNPLLLMLISVAKSIFCK
jgi:hypothetical protein